MPARPGRRRPGHRRGLPRRAQRLRRPEAASGVVVTAGCRTFASARWLLARPMLLPGPPERRNPVLRASAHSEAGRPDRTRPRRPARLFRTCDRPRGGRPVRRGDDRSTTLSADLRRADRQGPPHQALRVLRRKIVWLDAGRPARRGALRMGCGQVEHGICGGLHVHGAPRAAAIRQHRARRCERRRVFRRPQSSLVHDPRCAVTLARNMTPTATFASSETVGPLVQPRSAWRRSAMPQTPAAMPSCWSMLRWVVVVAPPTDYSTAVVFDVVAIACPSPCTKAAAAGSRKRVR